MSNTANPVPIPRRSMNTSSLIITIGCRASPLGIQTRYDAINLGLAGTYQRAYLSNIRSDKVDEGSMGVFAEATVHWSTWLKTTFGWRGNFLRCDGRLHLRRQ